MEYGYTIIATAPADLTKVREGEIYEAHLFTDAQLLTLKRVGFKIQKGEIKDPGQHEGKKVVRFS